MGTRISSKRGEKIIGEQLSENAGSLQLPWVLASTTFVLTWQFCDLPDIIGYGCEDYTKERYKEIIESGAFFIVLELSASHVGFRKKRNSFVSQRFS